MTGRENETRQSEEGSTEEKGGCTTKRKPDNLLPVWQQFGRERSLPTQVSLHLDGPCDPRTADLTLLTLQMSPEFRKSETLLFQISTF